MNTIAATSIDPAEVAKFSRMAAEWWDESGTSGPLHRLNPARMAYIRAQVEGCFRSPSPLWEREGAHLVRDGKGEGAPDQSAPSPVRPTGQPTSPVQGEVNQLKPFTGFTFADIGCGGGIVCEPLARLGAAVTGVDASAEAIAVAKVHAGEAGLAIDYRTGTSSHLAATGARFDVVLALEVVEHVADVPGFVASLKALLKPDGLLILSTPNRTAQSYLSVIVGAERILRWLPRGTHEWKRFLKPSELARHLRANGLAVKDVSGIVYDPVKREFSLSRTDVRVNYLMSASPTSMSSRT